MKFKDLRENIAARMVSMAVKHTTPKKKPLVKEGDVADAVMGKETMDSLRRIRQSQKEQETMSSAEKSKKAADFWNKQLTKEGSAEDAFADLNKEIGRVKFKSNYMDTDKGAEAIGPSSKNYSDNNPATPSGTTSKSYMDKGPATPIKPPPSYVKSKVKDLPEENSPQTGDGIYLELGESVIETEIIGETDDGYVLFVDEEAEKILQKTVTSEATYQGKNVPLNKPMSGDVAKSKVYVKGPSGRVVKVNFGDKNMAIKKHIPSRRKSFRARHRCETPGPKHKARYWSCKAW
jgi:hypothetical protein